MWEEFFHYFPLSIVVYIIVSIPVVIDVFVVSVALGCKGVTGWTGLLACLCFGLFHILMGLCFRDIVHDSKFFFDNFIQIIISIPFAFSALSLLIWTGSRESLDWKKFGLMIFLLTSYDVPVILAGANAPSVYAVPTGIVAVLAGYLGIRLGNKQLEKETLNPGCFVGAMAVVFCLSIICMAVGSIRPD